MACPRPWTPTSYMLATSKGALATGEARGKRAVRRLLPPELGAGKARGRRAGRRSDRRSLRPASKETLAAGGACGRESSQPASKEAQRPAKLGTLEAGRRGGRRSSRPASRGNTAVGVCGLQVGERDGRRAWERGGGGVVTCSRRAARERERERAGPHGRRDGDA
ncbi:hypothetical protein PVAP13_7KG118310 [Panicum virgatum]|uniref:Uncharacterized protein n=1 Tax=Panicum virgatum TaxID=38727 RepID=A0A8T0QAI7_PANVG|nr:hypothetical protein PVAP13_7KG118310 [Panicum virgatum]